MKCDTSPITRLYNASVQVTKCRQDAMIIRVFPDGAKTVYSGGQYGSLGLGSQREPGKLLKRAYSVSSPIVDLESGRLIDPAECAFYEFYFNLVGGSPEGREQLTPKLFSLADGNRIFCGQKITGHYSADVVPEGRDVLLIASMTGEAANNSIVNSLLLNNRTTRICNIVIGDHWESLYRAEHVATMKAFPSYKHLSMDATPLSRLEAILNRCCVDSGYSSETLGFHLSPATSHILLCGDPGMIGAATKQGAWGYEFPDAGIIPALSKRGFDVGTRFQQGALNYESYW